MRAGCNAIVSTIVTVKTACRYYPPMLEAVLARYPPILALSLRVLTHLTEAHAGSPPMSIIAVIGSLNPQSNHSSVHYRSLAHHASPFFSRRPHCATPTLVGIEVDEVKKYHHSPYGALCVLLQSCNFANPAPADEILPVYSQDNEASGFCSRLRTWSYLKQGCLQL